MLILITYILCLSSFCEIWGLCVSWITYDNLYYAPCLACWALFGSLLPAMYDRASCTQVHRLPQSHCGDNRESTLFSWENIYYAHLVSVEHSVCHGSLITTLLGLVCLPFDKIEEEILYTNRKAATNWQKQQLTQAQEILNILQIKFAIGVFDKTLFYAKHIYGLKESITFSMTS